MVPKRQENTLRFPAAQQGPMELQQGGPGAPWALPGAPWGPQGSPWGPQRHPGAHRVPPGSWRAAESETAGASGNEHLLEGRGRDIITRYTDVAPQVVENFGCKRRRK